MFPEAKPTGGLAPSEPNRLSSPTRLGWFLSLTYLGGYVLLAQIGDLDPGKRLSLNLLFLLAPLAATAALAVAALRATGRHRAAWLLVCASTASWTLGQVAWAYYDISGVRAERPSLADAGFLLAVGFAVAGLLLMWPWKGAKWLGARAVLEGAVLGASLFVALWAFVLDPQRRPPSAVAMEPLGYLYPVSGMLILTAALLILPRVSEMDARRRLLLGASILAITAGNSASLVLATTNSYHIGHPIDLLWLGGFLLLAAFAAHRERPIVRIPASLQQMPSPNVLTFPTVGFALLAGALDVIWDGGLDTVLFVAGASLLVCLLALQRLGQLDARNLMNEVERQAGELRTANTRLDLERRRLETAQRFAGLSEWEWDRTSHAFRDRGVGEGTANGVASVLSADSIEPGDFANLQSAVDRVASGDLAALDVQVRLRPTDHGTRWVRVWTEKADDPGHGVVAGFAQDITVLKDVELARLQHLEREAEVERLQELDRMRATFINIAAHELNTPLTPIKIQLDLLRRAYGPDLRPEGTKAFEVLSRNVERLANLVVDLLDSGRLQAGRMKFNFSRVDLAQMAHEALESFEAPAVRADITLSFTNRGRLFVRADPGRLHEVLDNLLSNALKFTPPGGRVDVTAWAEDGVAVVRFQDTGLGLNPDGLRQLFQPFSQVEKPVRPTDSGSGLGLYIVRGIVAAHDGTIEAQSDGPGKGCTFILRLPLLTATATAVAARPAEHDNPSKGQGDVPAEGPNAVSR